MRMISFLLLDLRLSAVGTPELRIAALEGWGMTLIQKSRMCIAPELRIARPCAWFRCIFGDYIQSKLKRINPGWIEIKPSKKQRRGLNMYSLLILTKPF